MSVTEGHVVSWGHFIYIKTKTKTFLNETANNIEQKTCSVKTEND